MKKYFVEILKFVDKNHSFFWLRSITLHLKLKFMKNKLTLVIAVMIMTATTNKMHAQEFMAGDIDVNLGIGLGGYLDYVSFGEFNESPLLVLSVDYAYIDDIGPGTIGVGGLIGYKSASYEYNYFGYKDEAKWTDIAIGGRGTYHVYLDIDRLDVYGVVNLGIILETYTYNSNYPGVVEQDVNSSDIRIYSGLNAGAKYYLADNFAAFAEFGYDVAWLKLGVTLKL